jgi:hypothetical protein
MRSTHSRFYGVRLKKASAEPLDEVIAVVKCKPPTREEKKAAAWREGSAG